MYADDDPIAQHLSYLIGRMRYIESQDEKYGFNRGRACETEALAWALADLGERYPGAADHAVQIADEREEYLARRRAEREQRG